MAKNKKRLFFNWSTGKDAALALYYLQQDESVQVDTLLTTINGHYNRVSMHGLRTSLMRAQAHATGLPLQTIELSEKASMEEYDTKMGLAFSQMKTEGMIHAGYGDIFLEDLKQYRDNMLQKMGLTGVYPIWKKDTRALIQQLIDLEFKAILICTNTNLLPKEFCGRIIDQNFLKDLPRNVDPCGENGEFHTFCYDGPIFDRPIDFQLGEQKLRTYPNPNKGEENMGFLFQDLMPIPLPLAKTCERCQTPFDCHAHNIEACACRQISLNNASRTTLAREYSDCLCANCLAELSHSQN